MISLTKKTISPKDSSMTGSLRKCYKGSDIEEDVDQTSSILGYDGFPHHYSENPYFGSFISGFKGLSNGQVWSFTELQKDMLDKLVAGNDFQVTSPDINCGSGKTTLTVGATIGLLRSTKDRILVVSRPGKDESPLTKQLEELVGTFSGNQARLGRVEKSDDVSMDEVVADNQVIFTSCAHISEVSRALVRYGSSCRMAPKVFVVFDESHQLFPSMAARALRAFDASSSCSSSYSAGEGAGEDERETAEIMAHFNRLKHLEHIRAFGKRRHHIVSERVERAAGLKAEADWGSCVHYALAQHRPPGDSFFVMLYRALRCLRKNVHVLSSQCIFLSAGGEFKADSYYVPSSAVVATLMRRWCGMNVHKVVSAGANVDSARYTKIFRVHRSGAEQIGGIAPEGYPMVYEAMLNIALNWMVEGRLLFIVRRAQVETFCAELHKRLVETRNSKYTYTSDKEYWNAVDPATGKPAFNIILVREEELDELEGVNFVGIKAVYLFSVGKLRHLLRKMQGLGRAGRIGQGYTYNFIFLDCATRRNAKEEMRTEEVMMECLQNNSTYKPQVVNVLGSKVLYSTEVTNVPRIVPSDRTLAVNTDTFTTMAASVLQANRLQICCHLVFRRGQYFCSQKERGFRCAWYHPTAEDFVAPRTLPAARFNISHCRKGVIFVSGSICSVDGGGGAVEHTVAPWAKPASAAAAAATAVRGVAQTEVDEAMLKAAFPALGEEQEARPPPPKAVCATTPAQVSVPIPAPAPVPAPVPAPAAEARSSGRHFLSSGAKASPASAPAPAPAPFAGAESSSWRKPTAPSPRPTSTHIHTHNPTPVCLFAVMGRSKCRAAASGRKCPFRHPEIAADKVTAEEFREAKLRAMENIDARRNSNGNGSVGHGNSGKAVGKSRAGAAGAARTASIGGGNKQAMKPAAKATLVEAPAAKPVSVLVAKPQQSLLDSAMWVKKAAATTPGAAADDKEWSVVQRPGQSKGERKGKGKINAHAPPVKAVSAALGTTAPAPAPTPTAATVTSTATATATSAATALSKVVAPAQSRSMFAALQQDDESPPPSREVSSEAEAPVPAAPPAAELREEGEVDDGADDAAMLVAEWLQQGIKGECLVEALQEVEDKRKPTAAAVATAALMSLQQDGSAATPASVAQYCTVFKGTQFGALLSELVDGLISEQVALLNSILLYCHFLQLPKLEVKQRRGGGGGDEVVTTTTMALVDVLFRALYASSIVEEEGIVAWSEAAAPVEMEGSKCRALVQLSGLLQWVTEQMNAAADFEDGESEEEQEQEQEQAEEALVVQQLKQKLQQLTQQREGVLSKEERRMAKRERRQERVAERVVQ